MDERPAWADLIGAEDWQVAAMHRLWASGPHVHYSAVIVDDDLGSIVEATLPDGTVVYGADAS